MTGIWRPIDLMTVRDAAVADIVPKMTELEGLRRVHQPAPDLQPRPRRVRVHRVALGQGRPAAVPLLAAQGGHRRRRGRLHGGVPHHAGGVRPAVRQVPEGSLQAVPRQGAAGRLRPQPRARSAGDALHQRLLGRAVALGRPARHRHRQPPRPRDGHRPRVVEGRLGHPQPDERLRPGQGLRVHRPARHALQHGAVDVVVADRRPPRLLRAPREVARADPAERAQRQRRAAARHARRWTTPSRPTSRPTAGASRSRRCRAASATSTSSTCRRARSPTSRRTTSPTPARPGRPTAVRSSTSRASAATRSCSASTSRPGRRRSSPSARTTIRRRSSSTPTRWCSRRRPPTRRSRSSPTSRATATSTTSGRSA